MKLIKVESANKTGTITLNNDSKRNAFDLILLSELCDAFEQFTKKDYA
jgi:enoyl-CoA hydratase/carnithine racemase